MTPHDPALEPRDFEDDCIRSLSDQELERELTLAAYDTERRAARYERLFKEWLVRRRGHRGIHRTQPAPP